MRKPAFVKNRFIKRTAAVIAVAAIVVLVGSFGARLGPLDPNAGKVSVPNGSGGQMWVPLYDAVPVSNFSSADFYSDGDYVEYSGSAYETLEGIDVSEHQGDIDWQAVHDSGVDFAIIRAGYRGYSEGKLYTDANFEKNVQGALAAGLKVGIYFFSQAVSVNEAEEEAQYLLTVINGYDVSLPVYFDWEYVSSESGTRTENVSGEMITDCCLAFCKLVGNAGYEPGVYFYRSLGYYDYALDKLTGLVFWVGAPGDSPDFYYAHRMWQYSFTGKVSGIEGETDLNLLFKEKAASALPAAPDITPGALAPEVTMPEESE